MYLLIILMVALMLRCRFVPITLQFMSNSKFVTLKLTSRGAASVLQAALGKEYLWVLMTDDSVGTPSKTGGWPGSPSGNTWATGGAWLWHHGWVIPTGAPAEAQMQQIKIHWCFDSESMRKENHHRNHKCSFRIKLNAKAPDSSHRHALMIPPRSQLDTP